MTDLPDIVGIPHDDEPHRYFMASGHDVDPETMMLAVYRYLANRVSPREAAEFFSHHGLIEKGIERTHYRSSEDEEVEPVSVLNVNRSPHPMTPQSSVGDPDQLRKRIELEDRSSNIFDDAVS
jgi:hypothetical protein